MEALNQRLVGPILVGCVLFVGVCVLTATRFFPLRRLFAILRHLMRPPKKTQGVSSFGAVTAALAGTVGTGNLAGVATALILGGPGALFWMWVGGLCGMATKYGEVLLAMKYRKGKLGGPLEYLPGRLPLCYALLCIPASFGIGNLTQINTAALSLEAAFSLKGWGMTVFLLLAAGFCTVCMLGGLSRIVRVTEKVMPVVAGGYLLACLWILVTHPAATKEALFLVCRSAFTGRAAAGGLAGAGVVQAIRVGLSRGVFTNEAGLGSAPMVHAAADLPYPAEQSLWGVFEVFFDTIVMCTLTGLVILLSGQTAPLSDSAGLTLCAFRQFLGEPAVWLLALSTVAFGLCAVLSWSYYGSRCVRFLTRREWAVRLYLFCYGAAVYFGGRLRLELVWELSDLLNGLLLLPNLVGLLCLLPVIRQESRALEKKLFSRKNSLHF